MATEYTKQVPPAVLRAGPEREWWRAGTLIGAKPLSTDFPFYQSLFLQSTILHLPTRPAYRPASRITADFVQVIIANKRWLYYNVQYLINNTY